MNKLMGILLYITVLSTSILSASWVYGTPKIPTLGTVKENPAHDLTHILENIKTFNAHFEQIINSETAKKSSYSKGTLAIQKPGRFNWQVTQPYALTVISDGHFIWNYDIDLAQVIKQDAKKTMAGTPAALLAEHNLRLEKDFIIKYADNAKNSYILYPKNKDMMFEEIKINFKQKSLSSMVMKDKLGNEIKTSFTQVQLNQKCDPTWFVFAIPKGVDIMVNK